MSTYIFSINGSSELEISADGSLVARITDGNPEVGVSGGQIAVLHSGGSVVLSARNDFQLLGENAPTLLTKDIIATKTLQQIAAIISANIFNYKGSTAKLSFKTSEFKARKFFGQPLKGESIICSMSEISASYPLNDSELISTIVEVPEDGLISNVNVALITQGNFTDDAAAFNGMVLCAINKDTGNMTELARTANSGAPFKVVVPALLSVPLVAPVNLTAGYYVVLLVNNWSAVTTPPQLGRSVSTVYNEIMGLGLLNNVKLSAYKSAVTTLTLPMNMSALSGPFSLRLWVGLS